MGKNFALYGVGKGVGIGAFGELRSGEGGGVPPVLRPFRRTLVSWGFTEADSPGYRPEQKVNRTQIF